MEDMTFRAVRILKEVDLVLAEDTRTSGILLKHFEIKNSLMSHHKFNEHGTSAGIVNRLLAGENVALISDQVVAAGVGIVVHFPVQYGQAGQGNLRNVVPAAVHQKRREISDAAEAAEIEKAR